MEKVAFLHHLPTAMEVLAERAFLRRLGGGCQIPVGARAWSDGEKIRLMGMVADVNGHNLFRGEISGSSSEGEKLGQELAERLLKSGADEVLDPTEKALAHGPS
jgi:hydroxymethylbilane synthase